MLVKKGGKGRFNRAIPYPVLVLKEHGYRGFCSGECKLREPFKVRSSLLRGTKKQSSTLRLSCTL